MDTGKRFGTIVVRHGRHAGAVRAVYTFPGRMTQRDENGVPYKVKFASELTDGRQKRYTRQFDAGAEMQAQAWLASEQRKIEGGTWTPPTQRIRQEKKDSILFKDYAARYIEEHHKPDGTPLTRTTKQKYREYLAAVLPALGNMAMVDFTQPMLRKWYDSLPVGKDGEGERAKAAKATFVKGVFTDAARIPIDTEGHTLIPFSPFTFAIPQARVHHRYILATREQVAAISEKMCEQHALAVLIAGFMGLREGEIAALRRNDVTLTPGRETLRVDESMKLVKGSDGHWYAVPGAPKSRASLRTVRIPAPLIPYFTRQEQWVGKGNNAFLFTRNQNRDQRPMSGKDLRQEYVSALKRTGIKELQGMHFHDLRHSVISHYANDDHASPAQLRALAGHTSDAVSQIYQQTTSEADRRVGGEEDNRIAQALSNAATQGVNALKVSTTPADMGESDSKSDAPEPVPPVPASATPPSTTPSDSGTGDPATIARMISSWDAMTRAMFLNTLPADLRARVVMKLATLDRH